VIAAGVALARSTTAVTDSGPRVGSGPLPAAITGTVAADSSAASALPPADRAALDRASRNVAAIKPGVPVAIDIPIASPAHPGGVHAQITGHNLNPDGSLFVPSDPQQVSWARQDAKPGSSRGTAILTSHINFVINGRLVQGAMSDLAWYAQHAIGQRFTVRLADGRKLTYQFVAGREYTKEQLAASAKLRAQLYDQNKHYGPADRPSGRLLLVSCGGAFDQFTGEYEDNVFLYSLPVS